MSEKQLPGVPRRIAELVRFWPKPVKRYSYTNFAPAALLLAERESLEGAPQFGCWNATALDTVQIVAI